MVLSTKLIGYSYVFMLQNSQDFALHHSLFLRILRMKPKRPPIKNSQRELFRVELIQIIDMGHGLVKLAKVVDWDRFEEVFGKTYCPDNGRPAISTRMMVALHYLKYTHNLSDEDVVATWVENPYWRVPRKSAFKPIELC